MDTPAFFTVIRQKSERERMHDQIAKEPTLLRHGPISRKRRRA